MPRYFFHVVDGDFIPDAEGVECESSEQLKDQAVRITGEMLLDQGASIWTTRHLDMFVTDENNRTHLRLSFVAEDMTGELE